MWSAVAKIASVTAIGPCAKPGTRRNFSSGKRKCTTRTNGPLVRKVVVRLGSTRSISASAHRYTNGPRCGGWPAMVISPSSNTNRWPQFSGEPSAAAANLVSNVRCSRCITLPRNARSNVIIECMCAVRCLISVSATNIKNSNLAIAGVNAGCQTRSTEPLGVDVCKIARRPSGCPRCRGAQLFQLVSHRRRCCRR